MFIPKRKQYHGPREKPCRVFVRFLHVSCKKPTLSCDLLKSARSLDLLTTQARTWILAFPPKKAKHGIFLQQRKSPAFTGVKYRVSLPRSPQREEPAQGLHTKAVPVAEPSRRRKRFPYTPLLLHGTGRLTKKKKAKHWKMTCNWLETTTCMCGQCQPGKGRPPTHPTRAHLSDGAVPTPGASPRLKGACGPAPFEPGGTTTTTSARLGAAGPRRPRGPGEERSPGPAPAVGEGKPQAPAPREENRPPGPARRRGQSLQHGKPAAAPGRGRGGPFPPLPPAVRERRYPPPRRPLTGRWGRERGAPAPRPGRSGEPRPPSRGPARNVLPPPPPPGQDGRRPRREGPGRAP